MNAIIHYIYFLCVSFSYQIMPNISGQPTDTKCLMIMFLTKDNKHYIIQFCHFWLSISMRISKRTYTLSSHLMQLQCHNLEMRNLWFQLDSILDKLHKNNVNNIDEELRELVSEHICTVLFGRASSQVSRFDIMSSILRFSSSFTAHHPLTYYVGYVPTWYVFHFYSVISFRFIHFKAISFCMPLRYIFFSFLAIFTLM